MRRNHAAKARMQASAPFVKNFPIDLLGDPIMCLARFMLWQSLRAILFMSLAAFFAHSATAQTRAGYSPIIAGNSGKCLNVYSGSPSAGATIIQYTCVGSDNQKWRFCRNKG